MVDAVVLSQGDEVVTGEITDTNAAWIAEQLTALGLRVVRHVTVGDHLQELTAAYGEWVGRVGVVVSTGGLGPTQDDLTTEALSVVTGRPLQLDETALAAIEARYAAAGRPMPRSNRKQALLPEGCTRLDNPRGTAPGFLVDHGGTTVACLPGVPHEMRGMLRESVLPALQARFSLQPGRLVVLRTVGRGESALQDRIESLALPPGIVLAFRTMTGENRVKLRIAPSVPESQVAEAVRQVRSALGSAVFSVEGLPGEPGGSLAATLGRLLVDRGQTLAVAESCTGGLLAAACTAEPGASAWFLEGLCTYSNAAKSARLGVPERLLSMHGAVSEPVARAMAEGVRRTAGTTWGIGTTGIAGPGGGAPDKPVGTVHVAVAGPAGTEHRLLQLPGDRARVQARTVAAALALLHRAVRAASPLPDRASRAALPPRS